MIKVVVGDEKAEWMVHEKVLLANSGFARAAIGHNTEEKVNGTIFLPEANPETFDIFNKYLYEKRLYAAEMDLDQLFLVYVLADYVDCPDFADLVFEAIYFRTSPSSLVSYTHKQIQTVLTSTLPDQPLHKLMLDQISLQILQKKLNFDSEEAHDILDQVMSEILIALAQTINRVTEKDFSSIRLPIEKYSMHVSRHTSSEHAQSSSQPAQPFEPVLSLTAGETAETTIGRKILEYIMDQSGKAKTDAIRAYFNNRCNATAAVRSLKLTATLKAGGISSGGNTTPASPPASSSPAPNSTPAQSSGYNSNPPFPTTPATFRGGGGASGRGTGPGRGGTPRGRGGSG